MQAERPHPKPVDAQTVQICRYVREPFRECHCMIITSANIPKIIAVCGDQFRSCPIYRRESQEARP